MSKKPALVSDKQPDPIRLTFDLHDLPTAQHRAGLAGLILQIDSMGEKGNKRPENTIPKIESVTATSATILFTPTSMQGVFDDLYAAKLVEIVVANKWPGKTEPKPGEFFVQKKDPKTGEMKPATGFAYDVVEPQAPCLSRHLKEGFKSPWHELWRQMVWSIPRGGNNVRSRAPFNELANGKDHCGEGASAWKEIVRFQEGKAKSQYLTAPISGALMLGAQAVNAEAVPFAGRVDQNLLLHFWQVVVLTFVPEAVNKKDGKTKREGYVLAIPDVADLVEFCKLYPEILGGLPGKEGKRPLASVLVVLPDQASLEVLRRLKERNQIDEAPADKEQVERKEQAERFQKNMSRRGKGDRVNRAGAIRDLAGPMAAGGWNGCLRAVESYHMFKLGNNVKLLSFSRVDDRTGLVEDYQDITARNYRCPLFKAALLRALLRGEPWHWGMIELFAEYPAPFFIEGDDTPKYLPRFGRDARELFRAFSKEIRYMSSEEIDTETSSKHLGVVIQKLVNRYVKRRAEKKTRLKVSTFSKAVVKNKDGEPLKEPTGEDRVRTVYPPEFREAEERICNDAFLAFRSRHDQDFVAYFAGTICSVDHPLSSEDYQLLVKTLMTNPDPNPLGKKVLSWEDVKAIAMIAVSAVAFKVRPPTIENQGNQS